MNAEILTTTPKKDRRWFLSGGLLMAVFGMRGILPWFIVWFALPSTGLLGPFSMSTYTRTDALNTLHSSSSLLLMTAGIALMLIFSYWILVEHKAKSKHFLLRISLFIAFVLGMVALVGYLGDSPQQHRAMSVGFIIFFCLLAAKRIATIPKTKLSAKASRRATTIYLEVLDTIFSVEAVLGAFAFTFSVPLILIGNGIGAIIVRKMTVSHGKQIRKIAFLKKGALYALGFLGLIMISDGLGANLPGWYSFLTTLVAMGFAFLQR